MATKYRIYEVAEELGVESGQLIQMLREMDVPVRSHMSVVEAGHVARLHARLERERRFEKESAKSSTTTRRRRRRRARPQHIDAASESPVGQAEVPEAEEAGAEKAGKLETEDPVPTADVEEVVTAETATVERAEEEVVESEVSEVAAEAGPVIDEAEEAEEEEEAAELAASIESKVAEAPEAETDVDDEVEAVEAPEVVEPEEAEDEAEDEPTDGARRKRKPKPVRRGMPAAPTASAAPGGTVRIQAEGYTIDGRRKARRERKKRRRVDQDTVQENVKKTLAALESGGTSTRRRRREPVPAQEAEERETVEQEREAEKKTVRVNEFLTVAELADLIDASPQEIITSAFKNLGLMVTINQRLDFDQIELICEEFGFRALREQGYEADIALDAGQEAGARHLVHRAPVVTVMGHVDHGKTSLLDLIRKTNVVAGESGGITQHIGAYRVELGEGRAITFLDTPGHEAFTAMRARGAELTDLVILVVAADDAVMPQTVEAISHAKNAGVPLVVAINKIDLPSADVRRVKQDLLSHEVVLEEFGGDVLSAEVSAKMEQGVDDLLEKVLLQAELLELVADPDREARATVVEAELDRGMGPVATVLVESGTLRVGEDFVCGFHAGRVRALLDERGNNVSEAGPSVPVRVLGIEGVPQAGDSLVVLAAERVKEIVTRRQQLEREKDMRRRARGPRLEDVFDQIQAGEQARLNLVIKGDTDGSVQALSDSLERLSADEVSVDVIHRGVGGITESDVLLASTSRATIIGFHVRPDTKAREVAEREGVEIRNYNVIYEAVEEVRRALEGMLEPEEREATVGTAEVRQLFRVPKAGTVAGCYVSAGLIRRNLPIRILRDQVEIFEGRIDSLKRFKDDVREVREGYECGISIEGYNDVKVGDLIECFEIIEVARTLEERVP